MNGIISVRGLNLWYGNTQALKNIDMDIPEKSVTALIGPSGCGKSTFLKTLNRMNDLIQGVKITGEVRYRNEDIFAPGVDVSELRREIGMVFQKPNPFPMSIYDNIAYGPRTHGIKTGRYHRTFAEGRRHMGRGQGQAEKIRARTFRRAAAASLYRPGTCSGAGGVADG